MAKNIKTITENHELVTLLVDKSKIELLTSFLQTLDYVEITSEINSKSASIEKADFKDGEKPSDFAGIWDGKKRDLKTIRKKAWQRKK